MKAIKIRTEWNEQEEDRYFSLVDVVAVLADTVNPTDYLKKMRKRNLELGAYIGTNCPQVEKAWQNGLKRKVLAGKQKRCCVLFNLFQVRKQNLLKCGLLKKVAKEKNLTKVVRFFFMFCWL